MLYRLALAVMLLIGLAPAAFAHDEAANNQDNVAVLVYSEETTRPVVGEITSLTLEFSSNADRFQLEYCHCKVTLKKDDQLLAEIPVEEGAGVLARVHHQFETPGRHTIKITGSPTEEGRFGAFDIELPFEVVSQRPASPLAQTAWLVGGVTVAALVAAGIWIALRRRQNKENHDEN